LKLKTKNQKTKTQDYSLLFLPGITLIILAFVAAGMMG
jgi:hypothetical protein